ncbi:macro domain-containing protein [soil metagenome]
MFSEAFPENTAAYAKACKAHTVKVGKIFVTENRALVGPHWILNFPTKKHWRHPSKIDWIRDGLNDLVQVIRDLGLKSIALPPLGCGNGGLDWNDIRPLILDKLSGLDEVDVQVFVPTKQYQNTPKEQGVDQLTPARALIIELIRRYSILGFDCTILEVQKLAWFLRRGLKAFGLEDPLRLQFSARQYGPYTDNLRHLLNGLDGSYIHCEKRLSDAGPFELVQFEVDKKQHIHDFLEDVKVGKFLPALDWTAQVIDGFESPFGMELLSTVDWLLSEEKVEPSVSALRKGLQQWPGGSQAAERKNAIFSDRVLKIALERLLEISSTSVSQTPLNM